MSGYDCSLFEQLNDSIRINRHSVINNVYSLLGVANKVCEKIVL